MDLHGCRLHRDDEGAHEHAGTVVQPTSKKFHIDFCTVARWNEQGEIVEENLFYDLMGMLKQIGVLPGEKRQKVA